MRIAFLFLFFCLFFQAGCFSQSDPYAWDFGRVKAGDVLKHEFIFKNDSKKTLTIKDVNTSCGCTVSEIKDKSLLPAQKQNPEKSHNPDKKR